MKWACDRLRDPASLLDDSPRLPLAAFAASGEGHALQELARRILADIGQPGADAISLDDLGKRQALLAKTPFNGDGIITPEAAADAPEVKQLIGEILAACGGTDDLCGASGIGREQLDRFYNEARAHIAWIEQGGQPGVQPLGAATAAASAAIQAVRAKIDDYFTRCRLTAYDPCAAAPLNQGEAVYGTIAPLDLQTGSEEIASLPLAQADAGRPLPLRAGVNPAWAAALAHFAEAALEPLLGVTTGELTEAHWRQVLDKIAPYEAGWLKAWRPWKASARRLQNLAGDGHARIAALLERDLSFASGAAQIADLEKLILYHNHLNRLLNNFVNFNDFYDPEQTAIFRAGRLYMDGRYFDLCVNVRDVASHATLAATSKIFLVYCDITRPDTKEKQSICVAVTAGFAGSLWVGRNGLFYDRDGRLGCRDRQDRRGPVSLKEAFWSPWIKISAMIGDQIRAADLAPGRHAQRHRQAARRHHGHGPDGRDTGAQAAAAHGGCRAGLVGGGHRHRRWPHRLRRGRPGQCSQRLVALAGTAGGGGDLLCRLGPLGCAGLVQAARPRPGSGAQRLRLGGE